MSEDRFAVIEKKLDDLAAAVAAGQAKTDARFDGIEAKTDARFDGLEAKTDARFDGLEAKTDARFDGLEAKTDARFAALEAGQSKADARLAKVDERLAALEAGQTKADARLAALEKGQEELGNHMRVLHEDVLDRFKALDPAPLIAASRREVAALIETKHEEVNRRLEPLERAFQQRSRRRRH